MTRRGKSEETFEADVVAVTDRAQDRLKDFASESPFSSKAFDLLQLTVADYIRSLTLESARIAVRQKSDVISGSDVERASQYLYRAPARVLVQQIGTAGGILLGAAIGNTLALTGDNNITSLEAVVTFILGAIGAFLIAFHVARELR